MRPPPLSPIRGTLELMVLRTLAAGSEMHGFEILDWIREATRGELTLEDGALYHALHRMERRGWVRGTWGISEKGRSAKYYALTEDGSRVLAGEEGRWRRYVEMVARISPREAEG